MELSTSPQSVSLRDFGGAIVAAPVTPSQIDRLLASRNASRHLAQGRGVRRPSSPFPASPAQGDEAGGLGFLSALGAGRLDRGQLLVRHVGLGEGAGAERAQRGGLPLPRFRDGQVHPARRGRLLVRGERAAVAVRGSLPGAYRPGGHGRGHRFDVGRLRHGHGAGREDPQAATLVADWLEITASLEDRAEEFGDVEGAAPLVESAARFARAYLRAATAG